MSGIATTRRRAPLSDRLSWAALRSVHGDGSMFGYGDLVALIDVSQDRATRLVRLWLERGMVERIEGVVTGGRAMFRVRPGAEAPPEGRTPEQNMWTALRIGGSMSPVDLAGLADTDTVRVSVEAARAYCQMLTRAGYLRVMRKAQPPKVEAVYRLIQNTGPEAPRQRRIPALHDPNKGTVTPIGGVA